MTTVKFEEAAYEAILKAMTPSELAVEYARVCEEPPPDAATVEEMIRQILAKRRP